MKAPCVTLLEMEIFQLIPETHMSEETLRLGLQSV